MLRRWLSDGEVIWTLSGLDLASSPAGDATNPELGAVIRGILERVAPLQMDTIQLVAMVNRPVTAATLVQLLDSHVWPEVGAKDVAEALDRLTDLGALRLGRAGYEFRHPIMRAATEAWVRPAARRRLHDRIARSTVVHESDRAAHWMQAAEPLQACDAAISSAREAQIKGDHTASRAHLAHGRDYADALSSTPADQVAVLRQLSEVARSIGDHGLAEDAEVTALDMALSTGLPSIPETLSLTHSGDAGLVVTGPEGLGQHAGGRDQAGGRATPRGCQPRHRAVRVAGRSPGPRPAGGLSAAHEPAPGPRGSGHADARLRAVDGLHAFGDAHGLLDEGLDDL